MILWINKRDRGYFTCLNESKLVDLSVVRMYNLTSNLNVREAILNLILLINNTLFLVLKK